MKRTLAILLVVGYLAGVGLGAPIVVKYTADDINGWQGYYNNRKGGQPWLRDWNLASGQNDCVVARLDRAEIQAAIDSMVNQYGSWGAYLVTTEAGGGLAAGFAPMGGMFDVDVCDYSSGSMNYRDVLGGDDWAYGATNYPSFKDAVLASEAAGDSMVCLGPAWTRPNSIVATQFDLVVDIPEAMVQLYLDNDDADGFFFSGLTDAIEVTYAYSQWSKAANLRLEITPEPATIMLIGLGGLGLLLRKRR